MLVRSITFCVLVSLTTSQLKPSKDIDTLIKEVLEKEVKPREIYNNGTSDECICTPYYLCPNGSMIVDGKGLLDIRMKTLRIGETKNNATCEEFMDVCCKDPNDQNDIIKPIPIQRKGCGQRNTEGIAFKITGDSNGESQFGEFPWMIALLKSVAIDDSSYQYVYICGGALIHESVVLTTAHCITRNVDRSISLVARAGEWDTQRENEIYQHENRNIIRTIIHPKFNGANLWNDFALLVVDKPFTLGNHIDTVCLPSPGLVPLSRECYVSGWGKDKFGQTGQYQLILKKIDLPIVTKDQCTALLRKTRLGPFFRLHESFVCAGGNGKDACTGDGGSPLACPIEGNPGSYEVTGLVAWGIGCGNETPGVYAGVAYARDWIDSNIKELGFTFDNTFQQIDSRNEDCIL